MKKSGHNKKRKRTREFVSDDIAALSAMLKQARRATGISQEEAAAYMGTSKSQIQRVENGKVDYGVSFVFAYARVLRTLQCDVPSPKLIKAGNPNPDLTFVLLDPESNNKYDNIRWENVPDPDEGPKE